MSRSLALVRGDLLPWRVLQAVLTYGQRWLFWFNGIHLLITLTAIGCFASEADALRGILGNFVIIQLAIASTSVTIHLKQQLDDWRSWLTPGFRLPHIAVAGIFVTLMNLGVPLLVAGPIQIKASSLCAAVMTISTLLAWTVYDPLLVFLFVATCIAFIFRHAFVVGLDFMDHFFTFQWSIFVGSATMMALLWACLSRLNGESTQQQHKDSFTFQPTMAAGSNIGGMGPVTTGAREMQQWISAAVARIRSPGRRLAHRQLAGTWGRIVHRRRVTGEGMLPWATGVLSSLVFMAIVAPIKFLAHGDGPEFAVIMLGVCPVILPFIVTGVCWPRRWPNLALESLLPASRQEFVFETAVAMAIDLFLLWFSSMVVAMAGGALLFPHEFASVVPNIAGAVALSALTQPCVFALIVWIMLLRNGWAWFGMIAFLMWGSAMVVSWQAQDGVPLADVAIWGGILATVTAVFSLDAYRRWCQTALG